MSVPVKAPTVMECTVPHFESIIIHYIRISLYKIHLSWFWPEGKGKVPLSDITEGWDLIMDRTESDKLGQIRTG